MHRTCDDRAMRSLLLLTLLLTACSAAKPPPSVFDLPQARPVAIVPLYDSSSAETKAALAATRRQVQQAKKIAPAYSDRDRLLQQAEQAARAGNNPRAQSLARQAGARAEGATEAQRTREAATLLKALYDTTGLSDLQLATLRAAETQLVRGNSFAALRQLQTLKTAAQKPRDYRVRRGDTLTSIAARQGVYGNSLLWPLIWQANRDTLPDPNRLRPGQPLKIRPSPSIDEVVQAIHIARLYPSRVRIGPVKTLPRK